MNSKARKRLLVATIVLVAAFAVGIILLIRSQGAYYRQVSQLASADLDGKTVKVGGSVVADSIRRSGSTYRFSMNDLTGAAASVDVTYSGKLPDTFGGGVDVVVVGRYDAGANLISADEMQTKCPSKYEASVSPGAISSPGTTSPSATPSPGATGAASP